MAERQFFSLNISLYFVYFVHCTFLSLLTRFKPNQNLKLANSCLFFKNKLKQARNLILDEPLALHYYLIFNANDFELQYFC